MSGCRGLVSVKPVPCFLLPNLDRIKQRIGEDKETTVRRAIRKQTEARRTPKVNTRREGRPDRGRPLGTGEGTRGALGPDQARAEKKKKKKERIIRNWVG